MIKETTQQELAQKMRAQLYAGVYREIDVFRLWADKHDYTSVWL